jgi:oxygen-dependent protoporphyrinogen oxidase
MIAIVGGGISGLVVAHELKERGVPHIVFEAAPEPGGVMRTVRVNGEPLDLGPQRTRLTTGVARLVRVLDLQDELLTAPPDLPLWVYRAGRLRRVPLGPGEAIRTDLLGWPAKLRILLEPFTRGLDPDETVARFFTRKFGREAYENLIGPFYGGLYASDPARMYARHGLRITLDHFGVRGSLLLALLRRGAKAREAIDTITFRDGLQTLPLTLARADEENVRLGTAVRALRRSGNGSWTLEVEGPAGYDVLDAETVVLSCPSEVAAGLLETVDSEASGRIAGLRVNRLAVVHLKSPFSERGYGYQVAFGETLETRGCTWNASIFGRSNVFTCYLGGMRRPDLVDWSDERIADVACSEFRTVTGTDADILEVSRTRIPAWDESWDALTDLRLPSGIHLCSNWSSRPGIPGRVTQATRLVESLAGSASPSTL